MGFEPTSTIRKVEPIFQGWRARTPLPTSQILNFKIQNLVPPLTTLQVSPVSAAYFTSVKARWKHLPKVYRIETNWFITMLYYFLYIITII